MSAVVSVEAEAAGPGQYGAPEWWPLRGTHVVGCTNGNGCHVPADGYHGYWALDINASRDSGIYAAGAGQVEQAVGDQGGNCAFEVYRSIANCPAGSRGNLVRIRHDAAGNVTSFYLHFTSVFVKTGDWVDENTLLGTAGDSGLAYPGYVHLHFERRHGAFPVDPVPLKACHGDRLTSYPAEFGKTSWSQVTAYAYAVRSDGTACGTGVTTTLAGGTTTTVPGTTTTAPAPTTTTTVAGGPTPSVIGRAWGHSVPNMTLFGRVPPEAPVAPTPSVALAADASNSPQATSMPNVAAIFGPATVFTSGAITVSTEGSLAERRVASATDIQNVNRSRLEVFTAARLQSRCAASDSVLAGSTTITRGFLQTSEGDPDVGGDETIVALPANPAPNTVFEGRLETVRDAFRYVFNEQVRNPDGSLTVYAAHLAMLGPTAIGDLYVGGVTCGLPPLATTATTAAVGTTTTAAVGTTTTATAAVGATTTTTAAPGATTTTATTQGGIPAIPAVAGGTTTSAVPPASGPAGVPPPAVPAPLARTGSAPRSLVVLSLLMLVPAGLALVRFSARLADGAGSATHWERRRWPLSARRDGGAGRRSRRPGRRVATRSGLPARRGGGR